jgi:hypothetical protein
MNAEFLNELTALINKYSKENESNTPDFILAQYLYSCLLAFEQASTTREDWYGIKLFPGGVNITSEMKKDEINQYLKK